MPNTKTLLSILQKYFNKDPEQAAHYLEALEDEKAIKILTQLSAASSSKILPYLNTHLALDWIQEISSDSFTQILEKLSPQQGASLFLGLGDQRRQEMIDALPPKLKEEISELLTFPEDSVGQVMSTTYLAFFPDTLVKQAIEKIRQQEKKKTTPSYLYVVDDHQKLLGILTVRDILLADRNSTVDSIMRKNIATLDGFMDQEEAASVLNKKKFFAMPVVDAENRLLGVVNAEQLLKTVQEGTSQDIQTMFGVAKSETPFSPMGFSLKTRLPWLHINLLTAFLAASVVSLFEDIIAKITVLAVFLPVVAGQGGNAGAQSLAVVMRGLVMRQIPKEKVKKLIIKEAYLGVLNGVIIGIVTGVIAWFWKGNPMLGVVITLAMIVNLFMAGLSGSLIPISMKAVGLDPAQSSSIVLTTVTDVVGFFAFLGFAVILQGWL